MDTAGTWADGEAIKVRDSKKKKKKQTNFKMLKQEDFSPHPVPCRPSWPTWRRQSWISGKGHRLQSEQKIIIFNLDICCCITLATFWPKEAAQVGGLDSIISPLYTFPREKCEVPSVFSACFFPQVCKL